MVKIIFCICWNGNVNQSSAIPTLIYVMWRIKATMGLEGLTLLVLSRLYPFYLSSKQEKNDFEFANLTYIFIQILHM